MMTDSFTSGVTYQVNPAGPDITDFNPTKDRLDFGEISVHGLILGALPDGTAGIVNPWSDQVQALQGLSWNDLSLDNLAVVGNEHLRQDIGAVLSWEQNIGAREPGTVYMRSHQFGVREVINDFDPETQKLNFLYTGTRERLSVVDTDQGLLIQFEPTNQSVLLTGVQRSDLIGANLEFHHDQVMEDNLEVPFGFTAEDVSLVSRAALLTPQAPNGAYTDGTQVRSGQLVNPDTKVIAMESSHSMHNYSMLSDVMADVNMGVLGDNPMTTETAGSALSSSGELQAAVAGNLYSGGMGGILTLINTSDVALKNWSFSFLTNQPDFKSWSAESSVIDLGGGRYQVFITPPSWGLEIPAGGSVGLSFNANSAGLPDSGALTSEMLFVASSDVEGVAEVQPEDSDTSVPSVVETPEVVESPVVLDAPSVTPDPQGISVSATITNGWFGVFAGTITVTNLGDVSAGNDWSVDFVMDAPLTTVSNFEVQSTLRSDGRYDVSLSPKSWSSSLDSGHTQTSYYQAAGEATDPAEAFDFGEGGALSGVVDQPSDPADADVDVDADVEGVAEVQPEDSDTSVPSVVETPEVVESPVVLDAPSVTPDPQGISVSATITNGWFGVFAGTITVTNLGDVSAGNDWSVDFVMDAPLTTVSNFEVQSTLRSDGRYDVSLSPKSWSSSLDSGHTQTSYYQAAGEATDPAEAFDFGEGGALSGVVDQPSDPADADVDVDADVEGVAEVQPEDSDTSVPSVVETPEVVESPVVLDAPSVTPDPQGISVSATITNGWFGVFAGTITVTNLGDVSAGNDWSVDFVMDAPLTTVSNFEVQSTLRSDGRYDVSLSPKSWSSSLDSGHTQTSYYQAAGEATDPAEAFDFGEGGALSGVVDQPSDPADADVDVDADVEGAEGSGSTTDQTSAPIEITDSVITVEPTAPVQSNDSGDLPIDTTVVVVEADAVAVDVQAPNGGGDMRTVTYFEEWGVYQRDINLSDVNGQAMTHLNYSFFDVKADGSIQLFDSYAAQEKRFSSSDQVSRTFTKAEYQAVDPALIAAYDSDRYIISESAESVTVTSVPVGWNDVGPKDAGNFEQLRRFKELNPNVQIGFALGGWTLSDEFSSAFATQSGRDQFTSDVVDIFKTHDFFTVVDFDWEYPGGGGLAGNASSSDDGVNFALVLEQLSDELDALELQIGENYEISIAAAGGSEKLANLNLSGINPYVDFYNVMTYDFHGGWENQTGHQAAMTGDANNYDVISAISVFEEAGVDLGKVVMGAPAYTRAWGGVNDGGTLGYQQSGTGTKAEGSFEAGVYDYKDIVDDVITGQTVLYWDDNSKAAFVYDGDEWSSIETTATIAGKAAYIQEKDLGGMMFWALSNDAEGDLSLVDTADDILRWGGSYADAIEKAPEFDYILGGNSEFSISDFTSLALI